VIDGLRRWERYSDGRVEMDECEAPSEMASADELLDIITDRHFNPEQIRHFLEVLTLEPMGCTRTAGRDCVIVRALPRPRTILWPHWLPYRADQYELHVDLARGVLLNIIGRYRGEFLGQHEVTEVAFDEPLNQNLFTYEPAPGDQVQPESPLFEELKSRDEAISRMPFHVLSPTSIYEPDYHLSSIEYHRPRWAGGWSTIELSYALNNEIMSAYVYELAEPDAELDDYEWERLTSLVVDVEREIGDADRRESKR
jgi:hypothetical protein